jgi:hypothetical protein
MVPVCTDDLAALFLALPPAFLSAEQRRHDVEIERRRGRRLVRDEEICVSRRKMAREEDATPK